MTDHDRSHDPTDPVGPEPLTDRLATESVSGDPLAAPQPVPPGPDEGLELDVAPGIAAGQTAQSVRSALLRYRVMAYVVGTLLVVLVVVGLPLKYIWFDDTVVRWTGIPHGWLYMVLLITAYDLGRRVHWSWRRMILIGLAGTVPFLSFVAERSATSDVRQKLDRLSD